MRCLPWRRPEKTRPKLILAWLLLPMTAKAVSEPYRADLVEDPATALAAMPHSRHATAALHKSSPTLIFGGPSAVVFLLLVGVLFFYAGMASTLQKWNTEASRPTVPLSG